MKRSLFIILLLIPHFLYAQTGISCGLNVSKRTFKNAKTVTGLYAGLYHDFKISPRFYIQPHLALSMGGVKMSKDNMETVIKSNYLELPVYASFRFPFNKEDNFVVNIGPYVAQGLFGKAKTYSDGWHEINSYNTFDKIPALDYGIAGGIAYVNKGNSAYFFIDWMYGLKEFSNPEEENDFGKVLQIRVRLAISLNFDWL